MGAEPGSEDTVGTKEDTSPAPEAYSPKEKSGRNEIVTPTNATLQNEMTAVWKREVDEGLEPRERLDRGAGKASPRSPVCTESPRTRCSSLRGEGKPCASEGRLK